MLVTLQQAKKLKELGYDRDVLRYYKDDGFVWNHTFFDNESRVSVEDLEYNSNSDDGKYSAPSVSEALEWFREVKDAVFEIKVSKYTTPIEYMFRIYQYCPELRCYENESHGNGYLTHFEAESALLDAIIKYLK